MVAITWLIIADQSAKGILDQKCLDLGQIHSDAVDYPKSGTPVNVNTVPKTDKRKPDWNAPETVDLDDSENSFYESSRAIGKLFRAINLPALDTAKEEAQRQRRHLVEDESSTLDDI